MSVFGSYRPRFRTSLKYRLKPFFVLSFMSLLFWCFQNFTWQNPFENPAEGPAENISEINASKKDGMNVVQNSKSPRQSVLFDSVSDVQVYETADGGFNVIKGSGKSLTEVDYLSDFDVSGKNCARLAQMAVSTGQHLTLRGIQAASKSAHIVFFQRVLDCVIQPQLAETASR